MYSNRNSIALVYFAYLLLNSLILGPDLYSKLSILISISVGILFIKGFPKTIYKNIEISTLIIFSYLITIFILTVGFPGLSFLMLSNPINTTIQGIILVAIVTYSKEFIVPYFNSSFTRPVIYAIALLLLIFYFNSRSGIISLIICFVLEFYSLNKIIQEKKSLGLILLLIVVILIPIKFNSSLGRILIHRVTLNVVKDYSLFGTGVDRFSGIYNYYQSIYFNNDSLSTTWSSLAGETFFSFNLILLIIVEQGIFGSILVALLAYSVLKNINSSDSKKISRESLTISALLISSIFSYPLEIPELRIVFIILVCIQLFKNSPSNYFRKINPPYLTAIKIVSILFLIILLFTRLYANYSASSLNKSSIQNLSKPIHKIPQQISNRIKFHHAKYYYNHGDVKQAMELLSDLNGKYATIEFFNLVAMCQKELGQLQLAESNLITAKNIMPSYFGSKMNLLYFYLEFENYKKAKLIGQEIINFPIKIPSLMADKYKHDARAILDTISNK